MYGAVLENQKGFSCLPDEIAVVGDEKKRPCICLKCGLQCLAGRNIHVIGRLVPKEEVRSRLEELCQDQPGTFASGQAPDFFAGILSRKEKGAQNAPHFFFSEGRKTVMEMFCHCFVGGEGGAHLIKTGGDHSVAPQTFSFQRGQETGGCLEKCSLSGAVGSDDADLLSAPDAEGQFHQEPEPQAPEVPEEPAPVTLEWKSEFNVEKYEKELAEKKEADHDGQ